MVNECLFEVAFVVFVFVLFVVFGFVFVLIVVFGFVFVLIVVFGFVFVIVVVVFNVAVMPLLIVADLNISFCSRYMFI